MHGKLDKVDQVGAEVCQDGQLCHAKIYMALLAQLAQLRWKMPKVPIVPKQKTNNDIKNTQIALPQGLKRRQMIFDRLRNL